MYTHSDPVRHIPNETLISPEKTEHKQVTYTLHPKTKVVWASLKFTKVPAPHSHFILSPTWGSPGACPAPKRAPSPHTLRLPRSGAWTPDTQSHTRTPTQRATVTARLPIGPTPSRHTRARAPCPLPPAASPQGAGDDRGHLAPRVLPPAGPRGSVLLAHGRAGAEAAHPFIPGGAGVRGPQPIRAAGRARPCHAGSRSPGPGAGGIPRGRGAEVGPRRRGHAHRLTHTNTWAPGRHSHSHLGSHTAISIQSHTCTHASHGDLRTLHSHPPHILTYIYTHTVFSAGRLGDTTGARTNVPRTTPHARRLGALTLASPPPAPSPSQLQRTPPCGSHSRLSLSH